MSPRGCPEDKAILDSVDSDRKLDGDPDSDSENNLRKLKKPKNIHYNNKDQCQELVYLQLSDS